MYMRYQVNSNHIENIINSFPLISVLTGSQSEATCKSKVRMILTGDKDESDIRTFPNITFQRGGIDSFVMTTRK